MSGAIIAAIVVAYVLITFVFGFMLCPKDFDLYTPADIHRNTKLNWFGCIILYILWIIFGFAVWLICSVYYIFHIGRNSNWRDD